jgi:hypothetical protein
MRQALQGSRISQALLLVILFFLSGAGTRLAGQSTYTSQLTGVVTDASGGVVPGAKVTLTDQATSVSQSSASKPLSISLSLPPLSLKA